MSKKKIKDNCMLFYGNNADDVTGSSIYIKFNGKQILLENGMVQQNSYLDNYKMNSEKYPFNPADIDYVFVGHCHIDHIGMIPRLVKMGFKGKIVASHETAILMRPLLLNSAFILKSEATALSLMYKKNYSPIYEEEDVHNTMKLIYEYPDSHTKYILDDVVSFEWLDNSHCIGSKQLRLTLTNELGVSESLLYTSDLGALNTDNHYLQNTEINNKFCKYVIMESTYGVKGRQCKKTREFDLEHLRVAVDTVVERGGTVLMPCFSFSRTQEILTNLYAIYHDKDFRYDIVVDSMLSCDICDLYDELLLGDNLKLWKEVKKWENVRFIREKDESLACVKGNIPKIVISSSGFCTNGRILSYLHEYLKDPNSMVIFSGYTGDNNSYLSYRIKNYKDNKKIKISGDPVSNNADCIGLETFSSHASRKDLIEIGKNQNCEKLILVHGSPEAKGSLKEDLQKAIYDNDKTFKVIASSKDMMLHL